MTEKLAFDGERFTPENVREIWYEHMHRYAFAARHVSGLDVLDAACGEGYGTAILSGSARSVTAIDNSPEAIGHAQQRYTLPNVEFRLADCCALPYEDQKFDCIVSFETIEHLENQEGMLAEFRRVLRPAGFLLISSPDKAVYTDQQGFDNPYHVRELYRDEFKALLNSQFPVCRMFGQKLLFHSAIWPLEGTEESAEASGLAVRLQSHADKGPLELARPSQQAMYLLAVCGESERALPRLEPALWLFDDEQESVYQHYQHEIRKNMQAGGILAERDEQLAKARGALSAVQQQATPQRSWLSRLGIFRRR